MSRCLDGFGDYRHNRCKVARGEAHLIVLVNGILKYEAEYGWLRFCSRSRKARVFRAIRKLARQTGVYDAWKVAWPIFVAAAVSSD